MKPATAIYKLTGIILAMALLPACKVTQPYNSSKNISDQLYRSPATNDTATIATLPWKQLFTDTKLQVLIEEGLNNNLDLKVAEARMDAARANLTQANLAYLPSLQGNASAGFYKPSGVQNIAKQIDQLYLSSSWQVDIWGKLKSLKRAALAAFLQSDAYKRAVQTQLVANIASSYYALMAYDAELSMTQATLQNRKEDVKTMQLLKDGDVVTGAAVVQSAANQYSVEVTIPDIKQNIRQTENLISNLIGRNPGPVERDSLSNEPIPNNLATGVPAQLLANRPDVQQAEYQLRNAFEMVNVARTYFYPSLTITGQAGLYNTSINNFFNGSSFLANIIGGLVQPIFSNGQNKQRIAVAKAQQKEYAADFQKTMLAAGMEVSNALYQYQAAADKKAARTQQLENLEKAVSFTKQLLKYSNKANYTDVLTSEQSLLAAQLSSINDKLEQLQAIVALYSSLGGGWK
ncbi:MAG: efflux transporter outer membrane subunit [Niabella sp.]|nr:efflux transporter outer membrane subunit [Niabella sp.]